MNSLRPEIHRGTLQSHRLPLATLPGVQQQPHRPTPSTNETAPAKKPEPTATPAPSASSKKPRFPSPPPVMVDKKGGTHFSRGGLLGEGGFARCYQAADTTGTTWACKVVPKPSLKSSKQKQKLIAEIKIHQTLVHDRIVRFKHVFEDNDNVYMILELCENGTFVDLLKKRKRLLEPEARYYMWQLLDGVRHMHRKGIIHRDLKLGNLFLTRDMTLKIGDYGLAASLKHDGERKKTICGTPNYIAPEILFDTQNGHSFEVDVWSLGVVMYTMLIGKPPFQTKDIKTIYKKIRDNAYEFPPQIPISENAKSIISSILNSRPECRPNVDEVMQHQFFKTLPIITSLPTSALHTAPCFVDEEQPTIIDISTATSSELRRTIRPPESPSLGSTQSGQGEQIILKALDPVKVVPLLPLKQIPLPSRSPGLNSPLNFRKSVSAVPEVVRQPVDARSPLSRSVSTRSNIPQPSPPHRSIVTPTGLPSIKTNIFNSPGTLPRPLNEPNGPSPAPSPRKQSSSLEAMYQNLTTAICEFKDGAKPSLEEFEKLALNDYCQEHPKLFITKWIDYSNKYGLGYQLRDGSVGVYFNDSTSIILASDHHHFEYLHYERGQDRALMQREAHTLMSFPPELQKKVTLLKHFKGYMQENLNKAAPPQTTDDRTYKTQGLPFLTKYLRTKHGVVFRLSNQVLQLNLFDHTKLILSHYGQVVTYIDKVRDMRTDGTAKLLRTGGREVCDRLCYLRDVLDQMIKKKQRRSGLADEGLAQE